MNAVARAPEFVRTPLFRLVLVAVLAAQCLAGPAAAADAEVPVVVRTARVPDGADDGGEVGGQGRKAGTAAAGKRPGWPKALADQARVVRAALAARGGPATAAELARAFAGAKEPKVAELLATLAALGQARPVDGGRYAA